MIKEEVRRSPRTISKQTVHSELHKLVQFYLNTRSLLCWVDKKLTSVTLGCEIRKSAENAMNIK